MSDYVSTNVRLPAALHRSLKHRAVDEGRSLAALIRESVEAYLVGGSTSPSPSSGDAADWGDDPLPGLWREATPGEIVDGAERHDDYLYGRMSNREER